MTIALNPAPAPSPYSGTLRRAVVIAAVLGSVLTVTNQPAAIFGSQPLRVMPMAINFATPLAVVAISQILAIRAAILAMPVAAESILQTILRHGILKRAIVISLSIGYINAAILGTINGSESLTPILLSQIYGLPLVFSTLSQTLAFRRASR